MPFPERDRTLPFLLLQLLLLRLAPAAACFFFFFSPPPPSLSLSLGASSALAHIPIYGDHTLLPVLSPAARRDAMPPAYFLGPSITVPSLSNPPPPWPCRTNARRQAANRRREEEGGESVQASAKRGFGPAWGLLACFYYKGLECFCLLLLTGKGGRSPLPPSPPPLPPAPGRGTLVDMARWSVSLPSGVP